MSTPYLPVHGFIIDGELTNSPELFVAAVENKQSLMVVDTALLGLLFPNEIPEELNTFLEPMFELSFESGLLICLDKTVASELLIAGLTLTKSRFCVTSVRRVFG